MPRYTVQSGDTLSAIARKEGIDLRDLVAANTQIVDTDLIYPGQTIRIPSGAGSRAQRAAASARIASGSAAAQVL